MRINRLSGWIKNHANNIARVAIIVIFFLLAIWAISLEHFKLVLGYSGLFPWLTTALKSVGPELAGVVIGVVAIDYFNKRRQGQQAREELRERLKRQLKSSVRDIAVNAIDELRTLEWLDEVLQENKRYFALFKWQGADLREANLRGVRLVNANLQKANLIVANLQGARLEYANLQEALLINTNLQGANLEGANLERANLEQVNLKDAILVGAILKDAILMRANLQGAELGGADLRGAKLRNANLEGANLEEANLQGANLIAAYLKDADLSDANLKGADLARARLIDANLTNANLESAFMEEAQLQGANLTLTNFLSTNLRRANLQGADLESNMSSMFFGFDSIWHNFEGADLKGANLQGITNWTAEQLLGAKSIANAIMPDGTIYEEWIKQYKPESTNENEPVNTLSLHVKEVSDRTGLHVNSIYAALKNEFNVKSYKDIQDRQLEKVHEFLDNFEESHTQ